MGLGSFPVHKNHPAIFWDPPIFRAGNPHACYGFTKQDVNSGRLAGRHHPVVKTRRIRYHDGESSMIVIDQ